jgi:2-iminobutanoate/2-iminopropanoate deaminase
MAISSKTWTPPPAVRRGNYVFTSSLNGAAADGSLDPSGDVQMRRAWAKLPEALASVGATLDEVVEVGVHIADHNLRPFISPGWLELFTDENSRPARRTTAMRLPPGELCSLTARAVVGGKRRNVHVPGVPHKDPLPGGAIVGNLLVSSALNGQVPNGKVREGVSAQIDQAYINAKTLLDQAGASVDDVLHFWVFMKEELDIDTLVEKWCGVFPTDGDRPARKSFLRADIQGDQQVHMQLTALLGGKRSNFEVAGVHHRDPIPMGARIGDLFMSSGVAGIRPDPNEHTPGGKPADGLPAQLTYAFANVETMMIENGGTLEDVAHLGILIKDYADRQAILDAIVREFPVDRLPAVHFWGMPVPSETMRLQLYATAVF